MQAYRFVTGVRTGPASQWDCTSTDPAQHWTSRAELYCWDDFRWALDQIGDDVIVTDSRTVADAWVGGPEPPSYKLLFSSNRTGSNGFDIYTVDPDGTGLLRITNLTGGERPSNQAVANGLIIYLRGGFANPDVFSVPLTGGTPTQLTTAVGEDCCPVWLTGSLIVFETKAYGVNGPFELATMNPDGSNKVRITNNKHYDGTPTLSPDGQRIAFRRNNDIYTMNIDGTNLIRLTSLNTVSSRVPAWSPDGTRIAFVSDRDGNDEIFMMNADGSGQMQLTFTSGRYNLNPSWSPDSTLLAFYSNRDGNDEIYTMNPDGTNLLRVTNNARSDILPSWFSV